MEKKLVDVLFKSLNILLIMSGAGLLCLSIFFIESSKLLIGVGLACWAVAGLIKVFQIIPWFKLFESKTGKEKRKVKLSFS